MTEFLKALGISDSEDSAEPILFLYLLGSRAPNQIFKDHFVERLLDAGIDSEDGLKRKFKELMAKFSEFKVAASSPQKPVSDLVEVSFFMISFPRQTILNENWKLENFLIGCLTSSTRVKERRNHFQLNFVKESGTPSFLSYGR